MVYIGSENDPEQPLEIDFFNLSNAVVTGLNAPRSRNQPARCAAPYSATSSPVDDPGRFGYLHASLSTLSNSDLLSGVEIAISRDLPQSQQARLRRAHGRSCVRVTRLNNGRNDAFPRVGVCRGMAGDVCVTSKCS